MKYSLLIAAAMFAIAGCGNTNVNKSTNKSTPAPSGTLKTGIRIVGGPAGIHSLGVGAVTIVGNNYRRTLRLTLKRRQVEVTLSPGRYKLSAVSGDAMCIRSKVDISDGTNTTRLVICSVK